MYYPLLRRMRVLTWHWLACSACMFWSGVIGTSPTLAADDATGPLVFESSMRKVQLIELYSSQGCSSCPPAERWLSGLRAADELWTRRVPLNFHVDYWDRLGWPDVYASESYTQRQYRYARQLGMPSAYTPGFMLDGQEWRGFFSGAPLPEPVATDAGVLRVTLRDGDLALAYRPSDADLSQSTAAVDFHVALLGVGLCNRIAAGENRGRALRQDFVVLSLVSEPAHREGSDLRARVALPRAGSVEPERFALGAWVTRGDSLAPLQATGGWVDALRVRRVSSAQAGLRATDASRVECEHD